MEGRNKKDSDWLCGTYCSLPTCPLTERLGFGAVRRLILGDYPEWECLVKQYLGSLAERGV